MAKPYLIDGDKYGWLNKVINYANEVNDALEGNSFYDVESMDDFHELMQEIYSFSDDHMKDLESIMSLKTRVKLSISKDHHSKDAYFFYAIALLGRRVGMEFVISSSRADHKGFITYERVK